MSHVVFAHRKNKRLYHPAFFDSRKVYRPAFFWSYKVDCYPTEILICIKPILAFSDSYKVEHVPPQYFLIRVKSITIPLK